MKTRRNISGAATYLQEYEIKWRINFISNDNVITERIKYHFRRQKKYKLLLSSSPLPESEADVFIIPVEKLGCISGRTGVSLDPEFAVIPYGSPSFLRNAFHAGSHDYLKDPWSPEELILRLDRLVHLWNEQCVLGDIIYKGNHLRSPLDEVSLSHQESKILRILIKQRGQAVSREVLFYTLWGKLPAHRSRVIDVHISLIKKKIHSLAPENDRKDFIIPVRGIGYMIT